MLMETVEDITFILPLHQHFLQHQIYVERLRVKMIINQVKIQIENIKTPNRQGRVSKEEIDLIINKIGKKYGIKKSEIRKIKVLKKSLDARKRHQICFTYNVALNLKGENTDDTLVKLKYDPENQMRNLSQDSKTNIIITGAGPAGLFCGYILSVCGFKPIIIEQGACIEDRVLQVEQFWKDHNLLNEFSNVSFGEGGAGTFSDGKLNTTIKDKNGFIGYVKKVFARYGAPEEIEYLDKPHIGTDELRNVIINIRKAIENNGGKVYFNTFLKDINVSDKGIESINTLNVITKEEETMQCDRLVLATGHSARKTYAMLKEYLDMEKKPFAVGFRVSHPQKTIDKSQYGKEYFKLPAADYKLRYHASNGRSVFSFCMCPGGYVVNSSTDKGEMVVNGMSNHGRDSLNANSAIVVNVTPEDFPEDDVLAGVRFQKKYEKLAYQAGNGCMPVQFLGDYKKDSKSENIYDDAVVVKGEYTEANLRNIYPEYIEDAFIEGMDYFNNIIEGFGGDNVPLIGVETRTSAPVRIIRDESYQSNVSGIYPCGEGAGYAGGIVSAAVDGIRVANAIIDNFVR